MKNSPKTEAPRLSPYLVVKDATRAIGFYTKVFGAKERLRLADPSGKIGHAELTLAGGQLMVADEHPDFGALSPATLGGTPVSLHLYVDDVDATVALAVEHGATLLREIKDEFYGDRTGTISDPFGHRWQVSTIKETLSDEVLQERWQALFR